MSVGGFDQLTLPNGLRLLGERSDARSVAVGLAFDVGARDEAADEAGAAHFLEHLAFKGDRGRHADDVNRAFDELGARVNAYTSHDRTLFYGAALGELCHPLTTQLLALARPALRRGDVDVERRVVLEEIGMAEDRPEDRAWERGARLFFDDHPLGAPVLGTRASLEALGPSRLRRFHRSWYRSDRALLVVTGAYAWDAFVASVRAATEDWTPGGSSRVHPAWTPRRGAAEERGAGFERTHLVWFAPAPSAQDPARIAAALLARVVGDDDNGRLFWALVEPGLVDDVALWFDPADGLGSFQVAATTDDATFELVVETAEGVLSRFDREGPTDDEWARAQRALATEVTLAAETPLGRLTELSDAWLDRGEAETASATVARILATPPAAGRELLERAPFSACWRYALRPADAG
ncbi:MAG: insulinase family protein [Trueperaceae bacterium]|nr:insulinase family protein [Trueperaceae bacterium]